MVMTAILVWVLHKYISELHTVHVSNYVLLKSKINTKREKGRKFDATIVREDKHEAWKTVWEL